MLLSMRHLAVKESKNPRYMYFAARHAEKSRDPEYRKLLSVRSALYRSAHPEKTSEWNAKRRAADPEKARKESREWFSKNKAKRAVYEQNRRAKKRERGGRLSSDIRDKLMMSQSGRCPYCKVDLMTVRTHLDHIMPLKLYGLNVDANIQVLCQACIEQKHAKHPDTFAAEHEVRWSAIEKVA